MQGRHFTKKDAKPILKQIYFALRPKFSGSVDLRLNRLNLRKIDEIIDSIKFPETWTLQEQIEKSKNVFGRIGSKYFDEELLTLYMMIRNEIKIKDA